MMLALIITAGKALWNTENPERTAGSEKSARRQNTQKHVMVPTYFVRDTATALLSR
jgi:hypothetical protein